MDLSRVLSKLLAIRTELSEAAPQTDKMSLELGYAIQELESFKPGLTPMMDRCCGGKDRHPRWLVIDALTRMARITRQYRTVGELGASYGFAMCGV